MRYVTALKFNLGNQLSVETQLLSNFWTKNWQRKSSDWYQSETVSLITAITHGAAKQQIKNSMDKKQITKFF